MAPTICSDKKQLRDTRRHRVVAMAVISSVTNTTTSSSSSSMSSPSSASTSISSSPSAAPTQISSVLSYVAKGSINSSAGRRRFPRLYRRLPLISGSATVPQAALRRGTQAEASRRVTAAQSNGSRRAAATQTELQAAWGQSVSADSQQQHQQMQLQLLQHSSSENFKKILQPNMANSSNSCSYIHRGAAVTAKNCDNSLAGAMLDDDGDSGYEYSQEPTKEQQQLQQHCQHQNSDGLLSIAIKTIKLVQRNKLLQKRLAQLQLETSEFIASVLANPENRQYREKISSSTHTKTEAKNPFFPPVVC
ncbi:cell wall integrity and stress response component 1 [Drosophila guanche]|uniref:cell wall integrity and stress response component 1 n=1 Tax=Drosophila guanche TaxID=7266 RepID=UPI001472071F|nr:cell wall integrity and stress response component 1 [Drosophila guanche]XP_034140104.1 cell wall integrity and stress response component 1 [Drosophila guanche]